jgi:SPP1 gp7 family putative phage head morphogenesis protein
MTFRQDRLSTVLDRYRDTTGVKARKAIVDELRKGHRAGDNPRTVARRIRKRVRGVALGRAMTIARTEMMVASWEKTASDFQRDGTVTGWQWQAALDGRTCMICRAMHGTKHPKSERLRSHPNCRCAMVPVTAAGDAIAASQTGEAAFRRMPAKQKRSILGDERYAAYRERGSLGSMVADVGTGRAIIPLRNLPRRGAA